eukprot:NODE_1487_length_959_cov_1807.179121_g1030_i0.p1 GENE.NODE_1487_length_959_cov_1807.179121_g1030_i0~~NODE_1487_length_959_cov_1807.179121_g1030_i0.p1  ORF type:complete len:212 (+),score=60.23 NODE_1487_length_959_cov_1807.179121_g1030_i0:78-713(+)
MECSLSVTAIKSVGRELTALMKDKIDGITLRINEDNLSHIEAEITGPENTPFEGGTFIVRLVLGVDYPDSPPKGYFLTRIFHPNISTKGEICVNTLKRDWKPDCGLKHVLMVIRCLLIEPNPESALNMDAGHLLLEDYEEFSKRARLFTQVHAAKDNAKENIPTSAMDVNSLTSPSKASVLTTKIENNASGAPSAAEAKKKLERKKSLKRL